MTANEANPVRVRAPGKVNLDLAVGARDDSGYHSLATIFQAVSVFEDVVAYPAETISVSVHGRDAEKVPTDDSNLAIRAAELLADHTDISCGVRLEIHKQIPVAGGMAGGSADAAAALVACDALWQTGLPREELVELAARLGADVPFIVLGHTAVGTGHGDQLTPAMARGQYHWVFAVADSGLATPAVYSRFDEITSPSAEPAVSEAVMTALRAGDAYALGKALNNDLQPAAIELRPRLRSVVDFALDEGALGAIVSGSGPTVAVLTQTPQHQLDLAVALAAAGLCQDVIRATGPVAGTRVVDSFNDPSPGYGRDRSHPAGGEWRNHTGSLRSVEAISDIWTERGALDSHDQTD